MKGFYSCLLLLFFINSPSFAMDPLQSPAVSDQKKLIKKLKGFEVLALDLGPSLYTKGVYGNAEDRFLLSLLVELRKRNKKFNEYDLIPLCGYIKSGHTETIRSELKEMPPIIRYLYELRDSNKYVGAYRIFDKLEKPYEILLDHYIDLRTIIIELVTEIMTPIGQSSTK